MKSCDRIACDMGAISVAKYPLLHSHTHNDGANHLPHHQCTLQPPNTSAYVEAGVRAGSSVQVWVWVWASTMGVSHMGCGMWDVGHGTWDVGSGMRDVGCGTGDVECGMWDVGHGAWDGMGQRSRSSCRGFEGSGRTPIVTGLKQATQLQMQSVCPALTHNNVPPHLCLLHWGSRAFNWGRGRVNRAPQNWGGGSGKRAQLTGP